MAILKVPVSSEDHIQGASNAAITLVEYGDYECPFCGRAYFIVKEIQKHCGSDLRFVFRNFPLAEIHPFAEMAAESAECAATNGLFWEMHDLIYENQKILSLPVLLELGNSLNIPIPALEKAIEKMTFSPKIQNDFLGGVRSGVNGTPTFFINEHRYDGSLELEDLISAIDSLLIK
jgi:protein-disulfide isomerase